MFKIIICYFVIIAVIASPSDNFNSQIETSINIIKNIEEFKKLNDSIELIPLKRIADLSTRGQIRYTLGDRVSNDRLVAVGTDRQSWTSPQNIRLGLQYPQSGTGALLSYVQVLVDQSSNVGRGYVVNGGIGQRQISIVIEAYSTTHFIYAAQFYGR